jgi:hypothetical protein
VRSGFHEGGDLGNLLIKAVVSLGVLTCSAGWAAAQGSASCAQVLAALTPSAPLSVHTDAENWGINATVYGPGADQAVFNPVAGRAEMLATLGGDDTVVILGLQPASLVMTGSGGDTIHICAGIDDFAISISANYFWHDADDDHVIFHPDFFRHAATAGGIELKIGDFNSINDRLTFILPEGVDASVQMGRDGYGHRLTIGPLTLILPGLDSMLSRQGQMPDPQVEIQRATAPSGAALVAPPVPEATQPEGVSRPPYVTPTVEQRAAMPGCVGVATALDWAAADASQGIAQGDSVDDLAFATGDIAFVPDGYDSRAVASAGDDRFALHDATDSTSIDLGSGRDIMVLCNMLGVHTEIALSGAVGGSMDSAPDVLVIDRPVFEGVPAGQTRSVVVQTFVPEHDRLVLVTPDGQMPEMQLRTDVFDVILGDVHIAIWRRGNTNTAEDFRAAITVTDDPGAPLAALLAVPATIEPDTTGPVAGALLAGWADARSYDGGQPDFAPPAISCADPAAADFVMAEELPYSRPYAEMQAYSAGPDIVAITSMPEAGFMLDMGEGDDIVYDMFGAGEIMLGIGADVYVFCASAMTETVISNAADIDPDLFIIGPDVLRGQPGENAALRNIMIFGVVNVNDRLVMVMPDGAAVVRAGATPGVNHDILTITHEGQETLIEVFKHPTPKRDRALPDAAFVFVPEVAVIEGSQP